MRISLKISTAGDRGGLPSTLFWSKYKFNKSNVKESRFMPGRDADVRRVVLTTAGQIWKL